MSTTGISTIDHAPQVVAEWLNEIDRRMNWGHDHRRSYHLLRVGLHAVRDWMTVEEAADLGAQLPVMIRGIYYDGFAPAKMPVYPRGKEQMLERVVAAFRDDYLIDSEQALKAIFELLEAHVSKGEVDQVKQSMRRSIRELWG